MSTVISDIKISEHVIKVFGDQINQFGRIETGGVLLGHLENELLIITRASGPGPKAIHEIDYFKADSNYIDMFIDMEVANSNGKWRYLGEWHTHPQISPYPSPKDLISLTEIADSSEDFVLMLILGAVKYKSERFSKQHIKIVKFKNDENFYKY